jgi:GNAT superfamily N-acetyltransferase
MSDHLLPAEPTIRPATLIDIPSIRDIALRTWPSAYDELLGKDQVLYMLDKFYSSDSLEDQMKKRHYFYLLLKEDHPVGFASFTQFSGDICKLQKLYVLPGEQKWGYGKRLLETVETVARSLGAKKLRLNVNRKNKAKNFYERHLFTMVEEEDVDIGKGYFMNDYIMEKQL